MFPRVAQGCGEWRPCRLCGNAMTIDVAKPEPGRIEPAVRDQEKKTPPSVRQWLAKLGPRLATRASPGHPTRIGTSSHARAPFWCGPVLALLPPFSLTAGLSSR